MKNVALALAFLAPFASADYLKSSTSITSSSCEGNAAIVASSLIGCESNGATRLCTC